MAERYDPAFQCDRKRTYRSKAEAKSALLRLRSVPGGLHNKRPATDSNFYRCPWCGYWHHGHKPPAPTREAQP